MADTRRTLAALQALLADNSAGDISAQDVRDFLVSVDQANGVQTGVDASTPSSDQLVGDLYLPTNGFYQKRWNGSAWIPWGPLFAMTPPVNGDYSWDNQGGASVSTTNGGIHLLGPAGAGVNLRIRHKTAPATPYTITAWFLARLGAIDFSGAGLCFRQSSDGKLASIGFVHNTDWALDVNKWTNSTTFSAQYVSRSLKSVLVPVCLRIADDATNRICSWSTDGQNFVTIHSVTRTDFLTADQVGFFVNAQQTTQDVAMTLLSWTEA